MAREAIALMLDVEPSTIAVEVKPQAPALVTQAVKARSALSEAQQKADAATTRAVRHLLDDGYTVRDAGKLLGISAQRVSQIAGQAKRGQTKVPIARRVVTQPRSGRSPRA
jgi:hypothetical protein